LKNGAPGEIRTPDHQVRSLVLYPTELRARGENFCLCRRSAETEGAEARSGIIQTPGTIVNTFFRKISFRCIGAFIKNTMNTMQSLHLDVRTATPNEKAARRPPFQITLLPISSA
jgi:hypothetical protein